MKRAAILTFFIAKAVVAPTIVRAQNLCWIERVVQAADGVALHFTQSGPLRISVSRHGSPPEQETYLVQNGVARLLTPNGGKETAIVLSIGDEAHALEMHSSCVLRVDKQGDDVGVAAEAGIYVPGRTPSTQRHFFVAE
ncbi:hypothetical protein [Ralstonia solanacearum]|uniref:hypothetical protein n=1 Tax=Ralstonia solanacearum TaxID=305 RepID=UPI0018D0EF3B|nr:hypothetical protein [Ralstonia solanacearum]